MPNTAAERLLHVAAAVIYDNTSSRILLARRPLSKHQGGKWEFPGGKVEHGEEVQTALKRELFEEIGIVASHVRPLIRVTHHYPDKSVLLDVHEVFQFDGNPHGREGQEIRWVKREDLPGMDFPAANVPILQAIRLPEFCLITPSPSAVEDFGLKLREALERGDIKLIQFRAKDLAAEAYSRFAHQAIEAAYAANAKVVLNSPPDPELLRYADGLHLTSRQLMSSPQRQALSDGKLLSASCHSLPELKQAEILGADFALLSPVKPTTSHAGTTELGWERVKAYTDEIRMPVYALGGLGPEDFSTAREHGAQGIAGISHFWNTHHE